MSVLDNTNQISSRFENLHGQVDDVLNVMKHNTKCCLERDRGLEELFLRAEALEHQACIFVKRATHVKKKTKLRARKWTWIFAGIAVIFIAVISTILFY